MTVPGDNSVDILTNDIGVVVITDPATGQLQGFDLLVGGGMGRTHRCDARLAWDLVGLEKGVPALELLSKIGPQGSHKRQWSGAACGRRHDRNRAL